MSIDLYPWSAVRFWSEDEIERREAIQARLSSVIRRALIDLNPAWKVMRCEGPILTPRNLIGAAYDASDIFSTDYVRAEERVCLRAETTASTYKVARWLVAMGSKLPLCLWQAGKSFRTERNDGASAAKLRFNEFWQLEFQCIYRADTKADVRGALLEACLPEVKRASGLEVRVVPSDRLPSYSESTLDIEVFWRNGWKEIASCSIRNDYAADVKVCEMAFGLDRLVEVAA